MKINNLKVYNHNKYPTHFFIDKGENNQDTLSKYTNNNDKFVYMKYLNWDTEFFNKKSYNIDFIKSNIDPCEYDIDIFNNGFEDTFISVKVDSIYGYDYFSFLQKCNFVYINTEIILEIKNPKLSNDNNDISIQKLDKNTNLPYEKLGSGFSLTRFHTDSNINHKQADLLWIEYIKNFTPSQSKYIYVAKINNEIAGAILINVVDKNAYISFISVLEAYRGLGIGEKLISKIAIDFNDFNIRTGTQSTNIKALKFYTKNGFIINDTKAVFHRWG